jgi:hypothetical protein
MNPAVCAPQNLGVMNVGEMLALAGVAADDRPTAKKLSVSTQELFRSAATTLEGIVLRVIEKRTAVEFKATVDAVFPKYFEAALGLSFLARATVPAHILERLTQESFSEMEAEFRDGALASFGAAVRDQAIFTVWTLRKISDLCQRIADAPPIAAHQSSADLEALKSFAWFAMLTRFNLECLLKSMQIQKPLDPEVRGVVIDGLRGAVNAYAWVRRVFDLRYPEVMPEVTPVQWDDEEQSLLDEATFDLIEDPA